MKYKDITTGSYTNVGFFCVFTTFVVMLCECPTVSTIFSYSINLNGYSSFETHSWGFESTIDVSEIRGPTHLLFLHHQLRNTPVSNLSCFSVLLISINESDANHFGTSAFFVR